MNAIDNRRCYNCHRTSRLTIDGLGQLACKACYVPNIRDPKWKGFGAALEDVIVAPPNAKNVTPR